MDTKNPYLLHISIGNPTSSFRNKRFNTHYFTSCYQASVRLEDSSSTAHSCSFSVCHGIGEVVRLWLWQIFWVHNQIPDRIHISVYSVTLPTFLCPPVFFPFLSCYPPVICPSVVLLRHIIDPPKPAGEEYTSLGSKSIFHFPIAVAQALDICLYPFGLSWYLHNSLSSIIIDMKKFW